MNREDGFISGRSIKSLFQSLQKRNTLLPKDKIIISTALFSLGPLKN
jgi:hypothetical protein